MKAIDVLQIEDNKGDQFLLKEYAELCNTPQYSDQKGLSLS